MVIYPKFVDNEVVFVRAFEVEGSIRPFEGRFVSLENCYIAITLCGIIALVTRNPFVIWMLEFGGIEIRNAHHFAISTNHYVLHSVLLTRVETCEFNPEVSTIVSLLELVIVRDGPFVEITHNKDIFSRLSFASCICTKGNFSRVNLIIIDTIYDTSRTISLGWSVWHASESSSFSCLCTRSSSKLNIIVTLFCKSIIMCELCTGSSLNSLAIDFKSKSSRSGSVTGEGYLGILCSNLCKVVDRYSKTFVC